MNHRAEILCELYKRGDYSELDLFEKQTQALNFLKDNSVNEALYGGGSRGGKSWLGCTWQLFNRMTMPNSFGMIAREELSKLKDTTLLTFFKAAKYYGFENDIDFKVTGQSPTAEFANGSMIFFREIKYFPSDPEFDRLGSYDLTDAFLDEAQQIDEKARSVLRGRFSILSGPGWYTIPKSFYSCNPRRNWIYTDFVKPQQEGKLDSDKVFIKSLPADNPHNDQSYIDNLMKSDKVTVQRLVYGNFEYDDDPSLLVDYDAVDDLFSNDFIKEEGIKHLSNDIALQGRDLFVSMIEQGGAIRIADSQKVSEGPDVEESIRKTMIDENISRSCVVTDSDGVGAYLSGYIKGIKTFHGNESPIDSKEYNNIKSQCGFKLAELINKRQLYIICDDVTKNNIRTEILSCLKRDNLFKDDTKKKLISKDQMKRDLGHSPDYFDTLLMLMIFRVKLLVLPRRMQAFRASLTPRQKLLPRLRLIVIQLLLSEMPRLRRLPNSKQRLTKLQLLKMSLPSKSQMQKLRRF